ncbi:hypothetical protein FPZ54_13285 [Sphingomonas suaedae]|uniref:asparagine synthase (glutamine-hydrolyzing) n=1 Tax=Sphingomonas suaedae TaxID=2599297 RepID=A0A518RHI1_9SPHN|nr:asparagine synthetase B family protein [Sphingomonas suaedae]QDX26884.1 hypothetical protein FPZ54_13285 [Sphingomonas suaedae]
MNIAPLFVMLGAPDAEPPEWIAASIARSPVARPLTRLTEGGGMIAIGDATAPHVIFPDGNGFVWGTIFDRMTSGRIVEKVDARLSTDPIERFVERQWGGYLAIRKTGRAFEIFRDPSGAIPCYHARIDGVEIFTTRPEFLFDAGLIHADIDWTILAQSLVYRSLRPARTPLRGVSELMPGTAAASEDGQLRLRTAWTPWRFTAPANEIRSAAEATEQVWRATTSCVGAWARCFERPLLEISGGLDSSIVAAVLAQVGANPACITFAAAPGDPDETPYARAAADHLGFQLEVLRADVSDVDLARSNARDLPRPCARAFAQAHETKLRAIAAREGSDAFFSGGGGDNVFGYLRSVLPVIDRWKRGDPGLLRTMTDMATLAEVSLWEIFTRSVQRAFRWRAARRWLADEQLLARAAIRDLPFPQGHPWVDAPATTLPGKLVHGRAMIVIQNHLEGLDRLHDAPVISPLISQPIFETCMAIPTWLWCERGMNRAVARRAFADRLPPEVIERRSKGAFDTYCAQVFLANRSAIREMLLGGALARQGLLDTTTIEAKLVPNAASAAEMLRLLDLVDTEAWICAWESRPIPRPGT